MPVFHSNEQQKYLSIRLPISTTNGMNSQVTSKVSSLDPDVYDNRQSMAWKSAHSEGTYRRRSMTIQEMLNPSDEKVKHSPRSECTQVSSDDEIQQSHFQSRNPTPNEGYKSPRSRVHSGRARMSYATKGGSRRPSHRQGRSPSSSPGLSPKSREFRHPYTTEEVHFIWYLRIDRGYLWPDILDAFNSQFSHNGRVRLLGGLQCRYYRLLGQNSIPQVRMLRTADMVQKYGMIATLTRNGCHPTYPWLGGQYKNNAYGEMLDSKAAMHR